MESTGRESTCAATPWRFFVAFLGRPAQVASVLPSSTTLERRLAELDCVRTARFVVELGPGTGGTTRALLERMDPAARLLCIEIVEDFVAPLRRIDDPRLSVVEGDALDLRAVLDRCGGRPPDVVVSGIPFATLAPHAGRALVEAIHAALRPGGAFVAYQWRRRVCDFANRLFGAPESIRVLRNLPPLWIHRWTRAA